MKRILLLALLTSACDTNAQIQKAEKEPDTRPTWSEIKYRDGTYSRIDMISHHGFCVIVATNTSGALAITYVPNDQFAWKDCK